MFFGMPFRMLRLSYASWCIITTLQVHLLTIKKLSSTTCEGLVGCYFFFLATLTYCIFSVFILLTLPRWCQPRSPPPPVGHSLTLTRLQSQIATEPSRSSIAPLHGH
jgi:hypothetical protein